MVYDTVGNRSCDHHMTDTCPVYQVGSLHNKAADSNKPIRIALVFSKSDWLISNVSIVFLSGRSVSHVMRQETVGCEQYLGTPRKMVGWTSFIVWRREPLRASG